MTSTSAFAPYDTSYAQRTPLITVAEYQAAPTALDTTNLLPQGGAVSQDQALQETINRASSWCDQVTCGAWGTLSATQNTENARVWGSRSGQIRVHPKYWPILSVDSFSYSAVGYGLPSTSASIMPAGNIWVEPQEFVVNPTGAVGFGILAPAGITTAEYFCQWQYTNGWPNTTLAASVAATSMSIEPTVVTGIYPGTLLTLYDLPYDEPIQVASTYVVGASVVPLTAPLQYSHGTVATVTNLPPAIKQAAILATSAFIKQRGSGSLVMADIGEVTRTQSNFDITQVSGSDWSQAMSLLNPFKMQYVGW